MTRQLLRELLSSVPDEKLSEARRVTGRAAGVFALGIALIGPPVELFDIATANTLLGPGLLLAAGLFVCFSAVYALSRLRFFQGRPEMVVFATAVLITIAVATVGFTQQSGVNPAGYVATFIPLATAAFVPWRPTLTLVLTVTVIALRLSLYAWLGPVTSSGPVTTTVALTAAYGLLGMVANQLHRRLWLRLEDTRAQLVARERMYALGCITAGVAHELKTPAAAVLNALVSVQQLSSELRDSVGHPDVTQEDLVDITREIDSSAALAREGAERVATFVHAIREGSRSPSETRSVELSVAVCLRDVLLLLSHRLKTTHVRIDSSGVPEALTLSGDRGKLEQILTNLIVNALDSCEESGRGGRVAIIASADPKGIRIAVEDDGPGVPRELAARIFEPMFTTRADGAGSGLGLAISRDLARGSFGGDLVLASTTNGARFELTCAARSPTLTSIRPAWSPLRAPAAPRTA